MNEQAHLQRAAALAAAWTPFPNPRVGCVIVDDNGVVVGEGAHRAAGTAHAEVHALEQAGVAAQGGTAYVTLEPCSHTGRTGPCTQALIAAGIRRVIIGSRDPNLEAAGGAEVLSAAGVLVEVVASPESMLVNEHWLHAMTHRRPFVTLKLAASLDGRVAAATGAETAISNAASRVRVHELRSRVDAVLVGTQTAAVDDPQLNVREVSTERQPLRFVMGERELPGHLWMFTSGIPAEQLRSRDPQTVLATLHAREVRHLLLEGGPTVARAFLEAGLVDECIWITAPIVLGQGPSAVGSPGLAEVLTWERAATVDLDGDLWSYLRPRYVVSEADAPSLP